jgi:Flp pilus assembly protein TadG
VIRRRQRDDRGAAAVEFALVLLPLMYIVSAIITFGWLFTQDLAIGNAAWQTARYSVVENRTCADVEKEALDAAKPLVTLVNNDTHVIIKRGVEGTTPTEVCAGALDTTKKPCENAPDKTNIYVTLEHPGTVLIPVFPGMGDTLNLDGKGVFRCEWS